MNTDTNAERILCYGDSLTFGVVPGHNKRYGPSERWTGALQDLLGAEYEIIEEGLGGRTTNLDDLSPIGRNGLQYFSGCLLSHLPLDLIIILLGTNDLKKKFNREPETVANSLKEYWNSIRFACKYLEERQPVLLLLSPPLVKENLVPTEWGFAGAGEKSARLSELYSLIAKEIGAEFLSLSEIITSSDLDGLHLDVQENMILAQALAQYVRSVSPRFH